MSEVILAQMFGKINSTIDESMTHHLETQQPFAQSLIWQLQRDYFSNAGIDAWRSGEVPQTITSNPVVGKTDAELVLAFLRRPGSSLPSEFRAVLSRRLISRNRCTSGS